MWWILYWLVQLLAWPWQLIEKLDGHTVPISPSRAHQDPACKHANGILEGYVSKRPLDLIFKRLRS